ncbi:MAG: DUF790 family protein [Proteobacteria bacterium]|nr:DUF790 family protein [Pseudomonadota bacterium]
MLTHDQLRFRIAKRGATIWQVAFIAANPQDHQPGKSMRHNTSEAFEKTEEYRFVHDFIGFVKDTQGKTFLELDRFIAEADHQLDRGGMILGQGLKKVLADHFLIAIEAKVAESRHEILAQADRLRTQKLSFQDYEASLAKTFHMNPEDLRTSLFADLEILRPLKLQHALTPERLIQRYNQALALGVLAMSYHIKVTWRQCTLPQIREVISAVKLSGFWPYQLQISPPSKSSSNTQKTGTNRGYWSVSFELDSSRHSKDSQRRRQLMWRKCLQNLPWQGDYHVTAKFYLSNLTKKKYTQPSKQDSQKDDLPPVREVSYSAQDLHYVEPKEGNPEILPMFASIVGDYKDFSIELVDQHCEKILLPHTNDQFPDHGSHPWCAPFRLLYNFLDQSPIPFEIILANGTTNQKDALMMYTGPLKSIPDSSCDQIAVLWLISDWLLRGTSLITNPQSHKKNSWLCQGEQNRVVAVVSYGDTLTKSNVTKSLMNFGRHLKKFNC